MDSLREQCRINLEIDTRALNDQGIGTDLPITFRATDMRLEFVLRHILDELNLTFVINDEVLLIITPEEGERWISTRLYLVGDLLGPIRGRDLFGDPIRPTTIDELIEMITTIVAPHCWSRVGGQGSLERFSEEDLLVVYQTDDAHDELVTTLARFRANLAKGATKADPSAEPIADGEPTRLVVYFVQPSLPEQSESGPFGNGQTSEKDEAVAAPHPCKADELAELIEELIEFSDEKERDDVYVRAVSGRLVIRHTDHVHKQIEKLLTKLRIQQADAPQQPWTDGLGGGMF